MSTSESDLSVPISAADESEHRRFLGFFEAGAIVSGEEVAQSLGLSRTAVWAKLKKLSEIYGLQLKAYPGKGYRFKEMIRLLPQADELADLIGVSGDKLEISCSLALDSTSSHALKNYSAGRHEQYLCVAEMQTQGRGRRDRSWASPFAQNLYFSLAFSLGSNIAALSGFSLVVGIVIASVLRDEFGVKHVMVKWPNDIYIHHKKLAGVLVELDGELSQAYNVVVGVGINVEMLEASSTAITQPWTSLRLEGYELDRGELLCTMVRKLIQAIDNFLLDGFKGYHALWDQYDYLAGKAVCLAGNPEVSFVKGVDSGGALCLVDEFGRNSKIHGGELSVRVKADTD